MGGAAQVFTSTPLAGWVAVMQAMQVAARSLDWQLEVQYPELGHACSDAVLCGWAAKSF